MWVFGKLQTTGGAQSFSSRKKPTPVRIRIIPNLDIIMLVVGIPKLEQYQSFKMFFSGCFTRPTPASGEESSSSRRRMCEKKMFRKKVGALFVKELVEADVFFFGRIDVFLLKLVWKHKSEAENPKGKHHQNQAPFFKGVFAVIVPGSVCKTADAAEIFQATHPTKTENPIGKMQDACFWMLEDLFLSSGLSSSQMPWVTFSGFVVENHVFERLSGDQK